jgi:hypothetical protein
MMGDDTKISRKLLRKCWGRWTAIVSLFAKRRPARQRIDPRAYAALRKDLIAACKSLAGADGERRSYYRALEETVRPWLSLRVFARTDREILSRLLDHCRDVERELWGRRWRLHWPRDFRPMSMITVGTAAMGLAWILLELGGPVAVAARDTVDTAWLTIKYSNGYYKLAVLAVLIVVGAMYTISRSVRPAA